MLDRFCESRLTMLRLFNLIQYCACVAVPAARIGLAAMAGLFLLACSETSPPDPEISLSIEESLKTVNAEIGNPVFIRIYKSKDGQNRDGQLELFVQNENGDYVRMAAWDVCAYSGNLGPKVREGDRQSPEGFYFVRPGQMNPNSQYHLSFNLGFPNKFDRAHGRTGSYLMVHGDCVSIGCYAMTDDVIEQIYAVMEAAFNKGQPFVRVHIFPFPMSDANLMKHRDNPNYEFWRNLKSGWDMFEADKRPPNVEVQNLKYVFERGS